MRAGTIPIDINIGSAGGGDPSYSTLVDITGNTSSSGINSVIVYNGQTFTTTSLTSALRVSYSLSTSSANSGGTFRAEIFGTSGGTPTGSALHNSIETANFVDVPTTNPFPTRNFVFTFTGLSLAAGTYWVGLHNLASSEGYSAQGFQDGGNPYAGGGQFFNTGSWIPAGSADFNCLIEVA